ncbi:RELT-like protein 1 [Amia ocellicauda]|uniref:RELT-like protein 1 n=1 Tax=Amia ocellicauda TaxID=2972642 RepID=UPI003463A05F
MADSTAPEPTPQLKMTAGNTTHTDRSPEYVGFALVPICFLLGLIGVLICHVLKRKGYRCTTESEEVIEDVKDPEEMKEMNDTFSECNADTVGQIVHCIMKNEANSEALTAMFNDNRADPDSPTTPITPFTPASPLTPVAVASPAKHTCQGNHLHTVGGVAEKSVCSRCTNKRWTPMRQAGKVKEHRKSNATEVTVLSVGRFRVTKSETRNRKDRKSVQSDSEDGRTNANGAASPSPTSEQPKSRSTSLSQEHSKSDK